MLNITELEEKKAMVYEFMGSELYVPMKVKELAMVLQVPKEQREDLEQVLDELLAEGKIEVSNRGKYSRMDEEALVGTYLGTSKGFGFVRIVGMDEDVYNLFR